MQVFPESIGSNGQTVKNGQGVKNEIASKADVRSGDGINSGSSNSGGGTDELGKMLLSRNFENGTLHIHDDITLAGTGIVIGPKLYNVELESLNSIPKERSAQGILYVNTNIQFPDSSEFEDVAEYFDNDSNKIPQTKGYSLCIIDILNNFTFRELASAFSFFRGYKTTVVPFFSIPQQVYSSDSEIGPYIESIEQELGCKIIGMIMAEGAIFVKTENDVPDAFKQIIVRWLQSACKNQLTLVMTSI